MLLLTLGAAGGCHSAYKVNREPMFVGTPVISSLRPEIVSLRGLGAPPPAVHRLQLDVRVTANNKPLGTSSETLGRTTQSYGQYVEEGSYRSTDSRCGLSSRNEAVAIGGFLVLLESAQTWSPDCGGGGSRRSEATRMEIVSGRLFPLQVGNRLELRYVLLESFEGEPEGSARPGTPVSAVYEVTERIADLRSANGRSVGEAYVIRVTENTRGKRNMLDFTYSTALAWRVGYKTDLTAVLADWDR
jgi:hypothetical protein